MRIPNIFMIGWELPPQNSGGLGVACVGLTKALADEGVNIDFTLPYTFSGDLDYLNVIDCYQHQDVDLSDESDPLVIRLKALREKINRHGLSTRTQPPFQAYDGSLNLSSTQTKNLTWEELRDLYQAERSSPLPNFSATQNSFQANLVSPQSEMERQVDEYSELVFEAAIHHARHIDVVHAHDWMSIPAALKIKHELGKPIITHIHSTEFDRTLNPDFNSYITRTEYEGMRLADKVIAVSYYTKRLLMEKYLIDPDKIEVVHNGFDPMGFHEHMQPAEKFAPKQPVVVFMGRLTMQKGADYFLALAGRILEERPDALFVMAGNGDLYHDLLFRNAKHGLSASVLFTDFIRGGQRDALLRRADAFVMPSVSEPFGLVALEAVQAGTPVVISRNSGVAEVLHDTPAIDFWDVERLAAETLAIISDPYYHDDLLGRQYSQLNNVTWKKSARKVVDIYQQLAGA